MTFKEASNYRLPFGKYKGEKIDDIASDDDGLRYLDWLISQSWLRNPARAAVECYLADPGIQAELEDVIAEQRN